MEAACKAAWRRGAEQVVVGLPVAPPEAIARVGSVADEVVCLHPTPGLVAVGEQYAEFDAVSDEDVRDYLAAIRPVQPVMDPAERPGGDETIPVEAAGSGTGRAVRGAVAAAGVVVFAHGSGSSRHSPRNHYVASMLQRAGLGSCGVTC